MKNSMLQTVLKHTKQQLILDVWEKWGNTSEAVFPRLNTLYLNLFCAFLRNGEEVLLASPPSQKHS